MIQQRTKTPVYRFQSVADTKNLEVDYEQSMHSRSLQMSQYIVIENDYLRMKKQYLSLKGSFFGLNDDKYQKVDYNDEKQHSET